MDITQIPRSEIYRDRTSIDEFDINCDGSIEKLMLERMYKQPFIMDFEYASKIVLEIFNMAHYITVMMLVDSHQMLHLRWYINQSMKICAAQGSEQNAYGRFFSAMAMAMVVNYLRICDDKYCADGDFLTDGIWRWHVEHYSDKEWDGKARFLFFNNVVNNDDIIKARQFMSRNDFMPIASIKLFESQICDSSSNPYNVHVEQDKILKKKIKAVVDEYFDDNSLTDKETVDLWNAALAEAKAQIEKKIPEIEYDEKNEQLVIKDGSSTGHSESVEKEEEYKKEIEKLKAEVERLSVLNKTQKNQLERISKQESWYSTEGDFDKLSENIKITLRMRIVFFSTVLNLDHSKKYTVASNLGVFLNALCNEKKENVVPLFSRMKKPEEFPANKKAAESVKNMLSLILPEESRNDKELIINRIIKSLENNYINVND